MATDTLMLMKWIEIFSLRDKTGNSVAVLFVFLMILIVW